MPELSSLDKIRESIYNDTAKIVSTKPSRLRYTEFALEQYLKISLQPVFDDVKTYNASLLTSVMRILNNIVIQNYGDTKIGLKSRKTKYLMPRHALSYIADYCLNSVDNDNDICNKIEEITKQKKKHSSTIGRYMGTPHSNVIHSIRLISGLLDVDKKVRNDVNMLIDIVKVEVMQHIALEQDKLK